MPSAWSRGIRQLRERLPARCEVCRTWPARPVCASCAGRFVQAEVRCGRCALPLPPGPAGSRAGPLPAAPAPVCAECQARPPALDACVAALGYGYPWDGLIARFKFSAEPGWAATFADLMRAAPGAAALLARAERVLPLPLAPARLAGRGYNQALELARQLAPGRVDADSLERSRETDPQASLDRTGRLRNVSGAFRVRPQAVQALHGRSVLLVDDVMTSGASLAAAAQALRRAGVRQVSALVLARTGEA